MSKIRLVGLIVCLLLIGLDIVALAYAASRLARFSSGKASRLGLMVVEDPRSPTADAAIQEAISIMRARLDALGVDSPVVERSPIEGEAIQILLPPLPDPERVKNLINADTNIDLRPVAKATQLPYPTKAAAESAARNLAGGLDRYEVLPYRDRDSASGWAVVEKTTLVTSPEIRDAGASDSGGTYTIYFSITPAAAARLADWTGQHIGDHLAFVLNNEVKTAPIIQSQIQDRVQITGSFTKRQAEDLALILRSGALPCRAVYVSDAATTSTHWIRKYGILTGIFALGLIILAGLAIGLVRARPPRQYDGYRLQG